MKKSRIPQILFKSGHFQTIYSFAVKRKLTIQLEEEVISTPDGDHLDLFWKKQNSKQLIILTHGLEGHAKQPYMLGMANKFYKDGSDVLAWNLRGCGKKQNKTKELYHGGVINDLSTVINHALKNSSYESISLIGFSLGANITLRYLGDKNIKKPKEITTAVAISAPCDLSASTKNLDKNFNKVYSKFFLKELKTKLLQKPVSLKHLDLKVVNSIKGLDEFNDKVTAPLHNFIDGDDYYKNCSSLHVLDFIETPTLILNSLDDPFLHGSCYPYEKAKTNDYIQLDTPKYGGHVGFFDSRTGLYFSESKAHHFVKKWSPIT